MSSRDPAPVRCSAIILSGGLNTRMGGHNKALLEFNGTRMLDRVLAAIEGLFEEILLVSRDPRTYERWPVRVVSDIFEARSSLTGVHAGLTYCTADHAFVVPCDAPFLQKSLIKLLMTELSPDLDVIVPFHHDCYQPLCAIYSKRCLIPIEAQLAAGNLKIIDFFERVRLKRVSGEWLKQADPMLRSFINVNTPQSLSACRNLIGQV